jgi:outer membrane murein-binding lipoprotein Lpp
MRLYRNLLGGVALGALVLGSAGAHAQSKIDQLQDQIQQIQQNYQSQIQSLQSQVDQLKEQQRQQAEQTEVVRNQAAQAAAEVKAASSGMPGTYHIGGVTLKVGGFIEAAGIYRSSTETSDVATGLNTAVPFGSNANAHLSEFRESARQSRLSLLAFGEPDPATKLSAYYEMDFLGMASTANSNQSNSYNLRVRQVFAEYDRRDLGFSFAGGQMWSLATLETAGLYPRNEAVPLTIDANYNVGFNWLRAPSFRFIENFAPGMFGAVSLELPQAVNINNSLPGSATPGVPLTSANVATGAVGGSGGLLGGGGNTQTFSYDAIPDIIAKAAWEPGWGHFELYGIGREFRTNVVGAGALDGHKTAFGGGIGAGAVLPVLPKVVDLTATVLWGSGIGKYGDAQLSDYTVNPNNGEPSPNTEITALLGVVGHVMPNLDLYGYAGIEHADSNPFNVGGKAYGYGNPLYTNAYASCTAGAFSGAGPSGAATTIAGCDIQTAKELQVGGWWNFYKGEYGRMTVGLSYAYLDIDTFSGVSGTRGGSNNIIMTSFRYYPF